MDRDGPGAVLKRSGWVGSGYRVHIEERRWAVSVWPDLTFVENTDESVATDVGVLVSSESILSCCTRWPMDRDVPEPVHTLSRWVGSR